MKGTSTVALNTGQTEIRPKKTSDTNYNTDITDGLYPFVCVNNATVIKTLTASEYVEVRMVFGAETDERFRLDDV